MSPLSAGGLNFRARTPRARERAPRSMKIAYRLKNRFGLPRIGLSRAKAARLAKRCSLSAYPVPVFLGVLCALGATGFFQLSARDPLAFLNPLASKSPPLQAESA
jgi:hypothetical protein